MLCTDPVSVRPQVLREAERQLSNNPFSVNIFQAEKKENEAESRYDGKVESKRLNSRAMNRAVKDVDAIGEGKEIRKRPQKDR